MTWAKVDDQLHGHPKLVKLGSLLLPCMGLYVLSLSWVSAYLTDGILSTEQATRLAGIDAENLVEKLCFAGFFDKIDGGHYQIHDYLDYNPSKKHALKVKKIRALVGSKGGKQKSSNLLERCLRDVVANGKQKSTPSPSPSLKERKEPMSDSANTDAITLLEYLNTQTGHKYRPVKANLSPLMARLATSTSDEIRAVIDAKVAEWKHDPKFCKYLRPETLFNASKFEQYRGQVGSAPPPSPAPSPPSPAEPHPIWGKTVYAKDVWYCGCYKNDPTPCRSLDHGKTLEEVQQQ